jgi:DNA (cytosine-5)-methyltransferase 1
MVRGAVVELYAGAGGWSQGLRMLDPGASAVGLDNWAPACHTAVAAGHRRVCADVATYPTGPFAGSVGVVASPPCQAFSVAGSRAGETDRARVHRLVDAYATGADHPGGGWADPRSHHTAQPVRWIRDLRPQWVAMEQVPPVLPLWQHIARVLAGWGYSTWCGLLNAADYGVPQTRTRAFLIASRTGPVAPPAPTHAKTPTEDLFGAQRLPWVSMAQALDMGGVDRPARTVCGHRGPRWAYRPGEDTGWTLQGHQKPDRADGEYQTRDTDLPAPTMTSGARSARWVETEQTSQTAAGRVPHRVSVDLPAPTVVANADRWELRSRRDSSAWVAGHGERADRPGTDPAPTLTGEAGRWELVAAGREKVNDRTKPRDLDTEPAHTVAFGHSDMRWQLRNGNQDNACVRDLDEPAGTLFFGGRLNVVDWVAQRPATTVLGDPRIGRPGHKDRAAGGESQFEVASVRVTVQQAAVLQSFPPDYPWQGTKTAQFGQVGNAVPPLLAAAVLAAAGGWSR